MDVIGVMYTKLGEKMIFRNITIRDIKGNLQEFYPINIANVWIDKDKIELEYWEEETLKPTKTYILKKEHYNYPCWRYFIDQLNTFFYID